VLVHFDPRRYIGPVRISHALIVSRYEKLVRYTLKRNVLISVKHYLISRFKREKVKMRFIFKNAYYIGKQLKIRDINAVRFSEMPSNIYMCVEYIYY
jgi:hypothetical protein